MKKRTAKKLLNQKKGALKVASTDEIYMAERIVAKRIRKGKVEYFVKWKDWPASTNTWEPLENLTECGELIEDYETRISKRKSKSKVRKSEEHQEIQSSPESGESLDTTSQSSETPDIPSGPDYLHAKDCGSNNKWIPEEIIGATDSDGELKFLIKFKGLNREYIVPSRTLRKLDPQMLIKYYEKHTKWMEE